MQLYLLLNRLLKYAGGFALALWLVVSVLFFWFPGIWLLSPLLLFFIFGVAITGRWLINKLARRYLLHGICPKCGFVGLMLVDSVYACDRCDSSFKESGDTVRKTTAADERDS